MTQVYVISDLHLGHKSILEMSKGYRDGKNIEEHDQILREKWDSKVQKRDIVYVLGDVAFTIPALEEFDSWIGTKYLIRGNHDKRSENLYRKIFTKILGTHKYKGKFWLSHFPVHPDELRGSKNVHGHVHLNPIKSINNINSNYISVCPEATNGYPILLTDIIEGKYQPKTDFEVI